VIYATGAQTDKSLGIPGEDLPGSWAATEFVAWYNGHPDYRELEFDLSARRAVVIGNGNVAADVARVLTLSARELERTDIADHALEALRESRIEEVIVLGRRTIFEHGWSLQVPKLVLLLVTAALLRRFKKIPEPIIVLAAAAIGLLLYPWVHS
jgi:NADPH-dependent glutamate synthase beta subunit-like oxidoreductase